MSGVDFLVDTNVLIYALEGHPAVSGIIQCSVGLSIISEMELLGKKGIRPHEISAIRHLLNDCNIMKLTDEIKDVAIVLKQAYTLKIPDAIVAATAIHWELSLVTPTAISKISKNLIWYT